MESCYLDFVIINMGFDSKIVPMLKDASMKDPTYMSDRFRTIYPMYPPWDISTIPLPPLHLSPTLSTSFHFHSIFISHNPPILSSHNQIFDKARNTRNLKYFKSNSSLSYYGLGLGFGLCVQFRKQYLVCQVNNRSRANVHIAIHRDYFPIVMCILTLDSFWGQLYHQYYPPQN